MELVGGPSADPPNPVLYQGPIYVFLILLLVPLVSDLRTIALSKVSKIYILFFSKRCIVSAFIFRYFSFLVNFCVLFDTVVQLHSLAY